MTICKQMIGALLVVLCAGNVYAQQAQQATPGQFSVQSQPSATQQPQSTQQSPAQTQIAVQPAREKASVFEAYVSEKSLEVTEKQFDIIKKFDGITFAYSKRTTILGQIAVPVKVTRVEGGFATPIDINAGYLVGTPEAINSVFNVLGISTGVGISTDIRQFGYDLFKAPATFAPVDRVPVGPDYVLGPGDEVRITLWGNVEGQWTVTVDRDGNIAVPKVGGVSRPGGYPGGSVETSTLGIVGVTGLTFKELKDVMHKQFAKYYTGFEMNIAMGALRTIKIYVVGYAEKPGAYTISSLSTLVNALFESGGPNKNGTMRDIQLKRNGKTVVHFDMYDFLLKGNKTKDVKLLPEDVIFIPPVGRLAGIAGNVRNPAIYELKNETRLIDLINMAGGLTATAFEGRIQIQRIENRKYRTIFEGDLIGIANNLEKNLMLRDGDLIKLFSVLEVKKTVNISGAVVNPGEYAIIPGKSRVNDIISLSNGLLYFASNQAELTRIKATQEGPKTERFTIDLSKAMAGDLQDNIMLETNDHLLVLTVPDWQLLQSATLSGEFRQPGIYTIKKGERLSSLIERAGGYSKYAYLRGAVFSRARVKELQQKGLDEMIARMESELLSGSVAVTATSTESIQAKTIEMEQRKKFIEALKQLKPTGRMTVYIAHLRLLKGSEYDIELEEGDTLFIPTRNSVVNVAGSVMSTGTFVRSNKMGYKDYIQMAGGYSQYADTSRAFVVKVDGSARRLSSGMVNWNPFKNRWEAAGYGEEPGEIEAGDSIIVPEKLDRMAWMRELKDITQILSNMGIAAGGLAVMYNTLK